MVNLPLEYLKNKYSNHSKTQDNKTLSILYGICCMLDFQPNSEKQVIISTYERNFAIIY